MVKDKFGFNRMLNNFRNTGYFSICDEPCKEMLLDFENRSMEANSILPYCENIIIPILGLRPIGYKKKLNLIYSCENTLFYTLFHRTTMN